MEEAAKKKSSAMSLILEREKEIRDISEGSVISSKVRVSIEEGGAGGGIGYYNSTQDAVIMQSVYRYRSSGSSQAKTSLYIQVLYPVYLMLTVMQ